MRAALVAGALTLLAAPSAHAADPHRWVQTGASSIPLYYYQGVTSDAARNFYFNGVYVGLYRTDSRLGETARNDDVIPPAVHTGEGYSHIGDINWDGAEGGRILLPLECYYPKNPGGENTCKTGSIGVADPRTLKWRYYVKLDPAEIPKAMWVEESPDGRLLWTSVGNDLLAYRTADVKFANAAPMGPRIHSVRHLRNVVPPTGITGGVFYKGRLYVAGQDGDLFEVWSLDLSSGRRRLEIQRKIVGESEGLDINPALGGLLHWMVQPYNEHNIPSYGVANGTLLHFLPRKASSRRRHGRSRHRRPRLRLKVRPRRTRAGHRVRFRFKVTARVRGKRRRIRGARIRFAGRRARTGRRGRAKIRLRFNRAGRYRVRATKKGMRGASRWVRVRPRRR